MKTNLRHGTKTYQQMRKAALHLHSAPSCIRIHLITLIPSSALSLAASYHSITKHCDLQLGKKHRNKTQ